VDVGGCVRIILGSEQIFSADLMFLVWMGHIVSLIKFLQLILAVHFVGFFMVFSCPYQNDPNRKRLNVSHNSVSSSLVPWK